jgi:hypothetical protein
MVRVRDFPGEQVMRRMLAAMFLSIALPMGANAFDNIEADVFYDGSLKEQIMKEYAVVLVGLQNQATVLGVEPRQKDINEAKGHFMTKALLMARCFDKGISMKKMTSKDIDLKKYYNGCVKLHSEFMSSASVKFPSTCSLQANFVTMGPENAVYDFLNVDEPDRVRFSDYVALRECYLRENHLPEAWAPRR